MSDQNFCLLQSGRSGGGHEISYTCLLSFSHLGMCDRHAQTAATDHQVLGICNTFDPIKVNFDTAFSFVTQVTNYKKCSQLGILTWKARSGHDQLCRLICALPKRTGRNQDESGWQLSAKSGFDWDQFIKYKVGSQKKHPDRWPSDCFNFT